MRRFFKISALILVYFLCTAKSCNDREQDELIQEQSIITATKDSLASVFTSDSLPLNSLRAFETTARLKLSDLSDFVRILADSTTDSLFKAKTCEMIRRQFIPGDVRFHISHDGCQKAKEMSLEQFLSTWRNISDQHGKLVFDSIRVLKSLQRTDDSSYSGQLCFKGHCCCPASVNEKVLNDRISTVDFFVIKQRKVFGRDTINVWEALLGDIK